MNARITKSAEILIFFFLFIRITSTNGSKIYMRIEKTTAAGEIFSGVGKSIEKLENKAEKTCSKGFSNSSTEPFVLSKKEESARLNLSTPVTAVASTHLVINVAA